MEKLRSEDLPNDVAPNFDVFGKSYFRMLRWRVNNFGRSMNESKFHLALFKPSTHLCQWSEIRAWSSAKAICRVQILPDLRKPFAFESFVKRNKTV